MENKLVGQKIYFLLFLKFCCCSVLDQMSEAVSQDITSTWAYKHLFPDLKSLQLDEESVKEGMHDGIRSRNAIENMLQSAIKKTDVNLFVLGGSVTQGGDLGENNLKLTYHYALAHWWNQTIGSITGSFMQRTIVAVGGVGTTYFGHCWQEYIDENDKFDFATWEFAINDPDSLEYEKAVERFTRDILSFASRPGLIFVNFASKEMLKKSLSKCRQNIETTEVVDFVTKKYSSASVHWENVICKYNRGEKPINVENLFTKNHPKAMAHAQIAYILISYFRTVIKESISKGNKFITSSSNLNLPDPLFLSPEEVASFSQCFSSITPGPWNPPKHRLAGLQTVENNGFTSLPDSLWEDAAEQRHDSTGGYMTMHAGKKLKLKFYVQQFKGVSKSRIYITIRAKYFGGDVKFTLDDDSSEKAQTHSMETSEKKKKGSHTFKLGEVAAGTHTLTIATISGGCNLCAIIVD